MKSDLTTTPPTAETVTRDMWLYHDGTLMHEDDGVPTHEPWVPVRAVFTLTGGVVDLSSFRLEARA